MKVHSLEGMKARLSPLRIRPGESDSQSVMELFGCRWQCAKGFQIPPIIRSSVNLWMVIEMHIVVESTDVAIHFILYSTWYGTLIVVYYSDLYFLFFIVILLIQIFPLTQARIVTPLRVFQTSLTTGREHNTAETSDWITTLKFKLTSCIIVCIIY